MSSHIHLLCKATNGFVLSDVMQDFKRLTSKIIETIREEPQSRREWMLEYFSKTCEHVKKEQKYKVWQNGYHAEHIIVINSYVKN
jgi:REP element-mobilizing transposase RayT